MKFMRRPVEHQADFGDHVAFEALARGVFEHELEGVMDELAVAAEAGEAPSPSRQSSPSSSTPSPTRPSPKRRISAGRPAARR
jgi:hypothetical protein